MMLDRSLCLIDEECDFLELEVEESVLLVHRMTSKVVTQDDVPVQPVVDV